MRDQLIVVHSFKYIKRISSNFQDVLPKKTHLQNTNSTKMAVPQSSQRRICGALINESALSHDLFKSNKFPRHINSLLAKFILNFKQNGRHNFFSFFHLVKVEDFLVGYSNETFS